MNEKTQGPNRFSETLSERVRTGLVTRIAETPALTKLKASVLRQAELGTKRLRQELLNLSRPEDMARWQILQNDKARYEIISDNPSHQKGEFLSRIVYNEIGDDLPLVKSQEDLRAEDEVHGEDEE